MCAALWHLASIAWQSAAAAALTQSLSCSADLAAAVVETMVLVGTREALVGMTAGVSVCSVPSPVRLTPHSQTWAKSPLVCFTAHSTVMRQHRQLIIKNYMQLSTLWRTTHTELTCSPVQCRAGVGAAAKAVVLALMQALEVGSLMSPDVGSILRHSDIVAPLSLAACCRWRWLPGAPGPVLKRVTHPMTNSLLSLLTLSGCSEFSATKYTCMRLCRCAHAACYAACIQCSY